MNRKRKHTILYVDEATNLCTFKLRFRDRYDIQLAKTGKEAQEILANRSIDLIIVDQALPDTSGADLLKDILSKASDIRSIFICGFSNPRVIEILQRDIGFSHCILKPYNPEFMGKVIDNEINRL